MKLLSVLPSEPEVVNIDPHVPLDIRWGKPASPIVYWRTGDLTHSLLELGISSETGALRTLTLVLPGRVEPARSTDTLEGSPAVPGVPVTDLAGTDQRYLDAPGALRVLRERQRLFLRLGAPRPIHKVLVAGRTRFGTDAHGQLAAIEIFGLSAGEDAQLSEALASDATPAPESAAPQKPQWIEVWIDSSSGEYLLVVQGLPDGRVEILDPQKGRSQVAVFDAYEDATHWLNEDEYDPVEGRWTPS